MARVLYMEDHDDLRLLIALNLEHRGFEVIVVAGAAEGLRLARSESFDLFLLGHTYPEASGVTVCRELRSLHPQTPTLFYSARAMPEERRWALEAGANDYLVKPQDQRRRRSVCVISHSCPAADLRIECVAGSRALSSRRRGLPVLL